MNEDAGTKPRNRWFQFDLRLLLVAIAAIGVILALEFRPRRRPNQTSDRGLIDTLRVGEGAKFDWNMRGTAILVGQDLPSAISEIGRDFVAIKDANGRESFVAISAITEIIRVPAGDDPWAGAIPLAPVPPKAP